MLRHTMPIHPPEMAPAALAWNRNLGAEARQTADRAIAADLLFIREARPAKIQFAPHRLVGSYAEYRKLNAGKGGFFG
jgi:hypothetical protein